MSGIPAGRLSIEIVAEIARLQKDLDSAKRLVNAASGDIAKSTRAANDNLSKLGDALPKASGRNRAALTQLSFQLNDVATMAMSGSGALQIFGTQAGQILQVVQQAEGGLKGLSMAVLGAVAPFTPLIVAIAAVGGAFALIQSDINKTAAVQVSFMDTALGAFDAIKSYLGDQLTSAFALFGVSTGDVWGKVVDGTKWAINRVIGITSVVPRAIQDTWQLIPAGVADIFYSAVNRAIDAINSLISKSVSGINGFIGQANAILGKANLTLPTLTAPQLAKVENSYAGAGTKLGTALAKSIGKTMSRDFLGDMADSISPFAQARARKRAEDDAKKAGKTAGSKMGKAAGEKAVENFLSVWQRTMVGDLASTLAKNQADDWKKFNDELANVVADGLAQTADATERARREAEAYADSLSDVVSQLGQMGKLGKGLGGILGLTSGNTTAIGGKLGDLLNIGLTKKSDTGEQIATTIGDEISKVFGKSGAFGRTMIDVMASAGIGMVAGGLMGQQSGTQKAGSAFGGALGGEFGKKFLSKGMESIAKGFGQFAGPLGGVIGGVVGNVLGGMFTKAKWGRVELTSGGASGATGNSSTSQKAALAAGNSFTDALTDLASSLGGSVGDFGSIALGVRGGDYRVNTGGTSLKTKKGAMDFGEDADAAVAYAMKQAIERGAINGVRASTNNLLKAGSDLQAQLNKALQFEGVFTDLKAATDPIGAELASVEKQFAGLRTVFAEAGASAAEYAQLEQLLSIKRQEALRKETDAMEDVRARIAEARGDEATAKAIERARELRDAISDNVRAELHRLYAIEDATAAQQAATAAAQAYEQVQQEILGKANRRNSLQTRVLELLGRSQDSLASSRLAELAATEKALQPLQAMVYQLEDLTGIVDKFGPLANDLRAFRKELDGLAIDKSFAALAASFRSTAAAAKMGDVTALTNLRGVSQDYLSAAKDNAATLADYQRAMGEVMGAVDQGIFAADAQIDYAKAQVEALNRIYDQQADNAAANRLLLEQVAFNTAAAMRLLNRFDANGMPTVPVE